LLCPPEGLLVRASKKICRKKIRTFSCISTEVSCGGWSGPCEWFLATTALYASSPTSVKRWPKAVASGLNAAIAWHVTDRRGLFKTCSKDGPKSGSDELSSAKHFSTFGGAVTAGPGGVRSRIHRRIHEGKKACWRNHTKIDKARRQLYEAKFWPWQEEKKHQVASGKAWQGLLFGAELWFL